MLDFQEKAKFRRLLYSKASIIVVLILILLMLGRIWNVYWKQKMARDNLNKTAATLNALSVREKMLQSNLERLKTENGQEEEIRDRYDLVKPDEEVIVIVSEKEGQINGLIGTEAKSFWQEIADWFR